MCPLIFVLWGEEKELELADERQVPYLPACDTSQGLFEQEDNICKYATVTAAKAASGNFLPHTQAHEEKSRGSHDT